MQGYHVSAYTGKPDPEYDTYSDKIAGRNGHYAVPAWGQVGANAPTPTPLIPCGNIMCMKESEALYCSLYCLETMEGPYLDEPEGTTDDAPLTEADLDTLLTALQSLDPAQREYLALTLLGPEAYCVQQEAYYVAEEEPVALGHIETASAQYQHDEQAGGLAYLACYGH